MFNSRSFRLGKVFGIPIEVNASWLVIFALVTFSLGTAYFPGVPEAASAPSWLHYAVGLITALLFFGSILAHELCHSVVAKAEGGHVDKITLFIFGGVAQMDEEPKGPGREFLMAAAGPAMSLLLALASFLAYTITLMQGTPWWIWSPLQYLAMINLFVAVFNMLPGFPLDGGRVLRSILWAITKDLLKATRWAVRAGQFIGWSMVSMAVFSVINGSGELIWFGLVGWFIATLAGQAYRHQVVRSRLEGVRVKQIMTPGPEFVEGDSPLETLVQEHFLGRRHSRYPVMYEGSIVGVVTLPDVKTVDRSDWPFVRTIDVTNRDVPSLVVRSDDLAESILPRLAGDRPGALLVVEDGRLVGIVTRSDVIQLLEKPENV
jgi:Zn-dependent protease